MRDFSINAADNVKLMQQKLRMDYNFDILYRTVDIGGKMAGFFFVDGFLQEDLMHKLMQFFMGLKENDVKDVYTFLKVGMPYAEVEKIDDAGKAVTAILSGIYLLIICLGFFIYKCINDILFVPHAETMLGVRTTRKKIDANKRRIKKIRRSIKKDTNEEMYGLESFDDKLGELYSDVERIEGERAIALEEFDNSTRPDIVDEIESRDRDRIQAMKTELEEKAASLSKLQDRVKQQKIYISSNYEAYIGSEFVSSAKLDSLYEIMRSTNVKTIGQALMVYDERK